MLVQRNLKLCSKWLKFYSFPCCTTGRKENHLISHFSQVFGKTCSCCRRNNILSEIRNRKIVTRSVPSLYVGAKAVVNMTITRDMVKCFAQATGDWNPIHFDAGQSSAAVEKYNSGVDKSDGMKGAPIVHGALLNGIVSGVIGTRLPGPGTVVVSQVYKFTTPLPVGSQVAVEVEVLNFKRREVNVRYKIFLIPGETLVMDGTARLMVPRGRVEKVS